MSFHVPEKYRMRTGQLGTNADAGRNGVFIFPALLAAHRLAVLRAIASDETGWIESKMPLPAWEHVSVSTPIRCPTWEEMCYIKNIFWDEEDVVIQFHPRKSDYVNFHPYCLHLWRPVGIELITPPPLTVGPRL